MSDNKVITFEFVFINVITERDFTNCPFVDFCLYFLS
ncbi:hypothetical protein P845_01280 [Klebsiella pneumoniae UCI 42]|nr:hypothetical protein P845_01280 [Klebsiella pneumoniae UCI 42]